MGTKAARDRVAVGQWVFRIGSCQNITTILAIVSAIKQLKSTSAGKKKIYHELNEEIEADWVVSLNKDAEKVLVNMFSLNLSRKRQYCSLDN